MRYTSICFDLSNELARATAQMMAERAVNQENESGANTTQIAGPLTTDISPRGNKSERAHEYIKTRIANGTYSSGFRLVLGQLAAELGMSVVPVREAIRLLNRSSDLALRFESSKRRAWLPSSATSARTWPS